MVVTQKQKAMLQKLKNQVKKLQIKEEQSRNKLSVAIKKVKKLGRVYKTQLSKKVRSTQSKIALAQAKVYIKVAADIERELLKGIEKKAKAVADAAARIEKRHAAKLAKVLSSKGKKKAGKKRKKS
jgi:hypothetical protein